MKRIGLMVAFLAFWGMLFAQTDDNKWNLGLHFNLNAYQGDLGNGFFDFDEILKDEGFGLSVSRYLSPTFDVTGKFSYFHLDYKDTDGTYGAGNKGYADLLGNTYGDWRFNGDMWTGTANLKMKLNNGWLLKEDAVIGPFIIGGAGFMKTHSESIRNTVRNSKTYSNFALYYGAGLNFRLSERLNMVLEAGIHNPMTDVYDGIDPTTAPGWNGNNNRDGNAGDSDDQFLQYSLGLSYNLGKKKDADGDGIADRKDKCPNTPAGVAVDEDGCPIDTDGDGVADYLDKCPNVPGTVEGCPDRDGDGIADKDDACPDVKGLKALKGCPDTDGDGVADAKDKCPDTPRGVKVDSKGCPVDTDGDGIADYLDKCPKEAGVKENNGCPKVVEKAPVYFDRVVHFTFGRSYIRRVDIKILNEVVEQMKENATLTANVSGYTDWIGSDALNQKLSERRANAVKKYLVSKGIDANRINTAGYGENSPVDTNDTAAGRANNRRAEIRIRLE